MFNKIVQALRLEPRVVEAVDSLELDTNHLGYDAWGFSPERAKLLFTIAYQFYRYFRPEVFGIDNLPAGRMLLVGNHSGQLPFDGMIVTTSCLVDARPPRLVRAMVERWFPTLPFLGNAFDRSGAVLGDPINCRNLLNAENAILVFPEGIKGSGKTWERRYQLQSFGRGFMRLALQTGAPVVPVAIIGGEESIPSLFDFKPLARLLGTPYWPVPPYLPLLGLAAYAPLPVRFRLHFGSPMRFEGRHDDVDEVLDEKVGQVKATLQAMVNDGLARRQSVFS